ncbi:hypothetical protein JCM19000A_34770 [Silvimonas sp. JCM 19000]
MKSLVLMLSLASMAGVAAEAQAAEYGRVISTTPVVENYSNPQQSCWTEQVVVQQPHNYGGALLGGIFGGLLGSTVGRGNGNVAATAAGAAIGALSGDNAANQGNTSVQNVQKCTTVQGQTQQRIIGYDVTYEYSGQRYTTRMAYDPGNRVPISVSVDGQQQQQPVQTVTQAAPVTSTTTYVQSAPVVVSSTPTVIYTTPTYYAAPIFWPSLSIGYYRGWGGGWGYHGGGWHH